MSATQTDPLHSDAVRIASVLPNRTRSNATPDSDTIQFTDQLSAILAVDPNLNDANRPAVKPIGLSSPDLNEPAVTSSHMQALKSQLGLVEAPDSITPLGPAKGDMKTMRLAQEQDGLLSSDKIIQTVAGPPAANRQFPSVTDVAGAAKGLDQTTDQPPDAPRALNNVKAHQVSSKPPGARKPLSPDDQALLDSASSSTTPVPQPGVLPPIPPEPMPPARVTSVPSQSADGRTAALPEARNTASSANARSADHLSTSVTSKPEARATTRLSDTVSSHLSDARDGAANIMPLPGPDFAAPATAPSGAVQVQVQHGVGIPLTVAYMPMTPSTASRPIAATVSTQDQITRPGDDPTDRRAEILPPLVDAAPPATTTTKQRRSSSSAIDPTSAIEPPKSEAVRNDAVLSDLIPVALSIPVVRSLPDSPDTTRVTRSSPAALRLENPAAQYPLAAAFGEQANPRGGAQAQVGTSLLTLASGPDGSSQMALTLHPKELGTVHIQLERNTDGAVRIVVTATEPATLRSLINDQAHLHATLDAASIPSAGRHLSFELGTPVTSAVASDHAAGQSVVERVPDTVSASQADTWTNADMAGFRGSDTQAGNSGRDPGNAFSRSDRDPGGDPDMDDTDSSPPGLNSSSPALRSSSRINITA